MACGTSFTVTDNNWNSTTSSFSCSPASSEQGVSLTATSIILTGTVIKLAWKPASILSILPWATAYELQNDYFTIEKSNDANHWETISIVSGLNNSHTLTNYSIFDSSPFDGISYYRLKQTDKNGKFSYFGIVSVNNINQTPKIIKRVNVYGQELDENATGLIILIYNNGEAKKIYK